MTLQQASDALARGENFYDMTWTDSPGVQDAFTYLPWTTVLLAPGRWLGGDVRWALAFWSVVLFLGIWALARPRAGDAPSTPRRDGPAGGAARRRALVVAPGTLTQVDQAWTEPLLAAGLVWWAVLVRRGHAWWAVVPLALACASKQHLALLLPLLLLWTPFGPRRAVATGALTGVLIAPWFLASPADFVHDTVTLLLGFHPIRFANTWYLYFLNEHGVTLPFWVTGVVVLGALGVAAWLVHRRQPGLDELLRWFAFVLLVANLVNKQAFYNQFWLSAALVAMSLAVPGARGARGHIGAASCASSESQRRVNVGAGRAEHLDERPVRRRLGPGRGAVDGRRLVEPLQRRGTVAPRDEVDGEPGGEVGRGDLALPRVEVGLRRAAGSALRRRPPPSSSGAASSVVRRPEPA